MKVDITTADAIDDQALCHAMANAFSDYAVPVTLTLPAFRLMMAQRGLTRSTSHVAIVDGQLVAIWLVSVRGMASYLISSGTLPAYRGKGLATKLALTSLDHLRQKGLTSFQTEVLMENTAAAALYQKLGMHTRRELSCYTITGQRPRTRPQVVPAQWTQIADTTASFLDWPPSWQNSDASVTASGDEVLCFGTYTCSTLTGYAVLQPDTGRILQIAVHPGARRRGIGTALVNHAWAQSHTDQLGLINADRADQGFAAFVQSFPNRETPGQFELHKAL